MKEVAKKILNSLNPLAACKKYRVPLWQCPQLFFILTGIFTAGVILATYAIAVFRVDDPVFLNLTVLLVGMVLLVIDYIIVSSFERMAEASRMKTEFIEIVSHQLRAPLTNLKFALQFLASRQSGEIQKDETEYMTILRENVQRMGDLLDELLTIFQIEAGEFSFKQSKVSLEAVTKRIILRFKPFIEASNVRVLLRAEKKLPDVLADNRCLEEVIGNLLDNAIRYTKGKGEVKIKVQMKNKKVYFEIKDTGVGIPKMEHKYIFQKFFRSEDILKHQPQGSGLGLFIAKEFVELLGGKMGFSSEEGKGSIFWFTLPRTKELKS